MARAAADEVPRFHHPSGTGKIISITATISRSAEDVKEGPCSNRVLPYYSQSRPSADGVILGAISLVRGFERGLTDEQVRPWAPVAGRSEADQVLAPMTQSLPQSSTETARRLGNPV